MYIPIAWGLYLDLFPYIKWLSFVIYNMGFFFCRQEIPYITTLLNSSKRKDTTVWNSSLIVWTSILFYLLRNLIDHIVETHNPIFFCQIVPYEASDHCEPTNTNQAHYRSEKKLDVFFNWVRISRINIREVT